MRSMFSFSLYVGIMTTDLLKKYRFQAKIIEFIHLLDFNKRINKIEIAERSIYTLATIVITLSD